MLSIRRRSDLSHSFHPDPIRATGEMERNLFVSATVAIPLGELQMNIDRSNQMSAAIDSDPHSLVNSVPWK